jgi:BirA family biotin operon repressor/biotin-[acetyl-CoA-carboxylase] ligase
MNIIKLDAIGSTNTFLKELVASDAIENYTVVCADSQLEGRGQMGSKWISEPFKNLLFSVLVRFDSFKTLDSFYLNYSVSLAIVNVLKKYNLPKLNIKWPNDILADSNKLAGVLIENSLRSNCIKHTIIGIGLNVNQVSFDTDLKNVKSLKSFIGKEINKEQLLKELVYELKSEIENCKPENFESIKQRYLSVLYKKEIPTMFKDSEDLVFLGRIINVSDSGKLQIELEDSSIREFGIKEIELLRKL